MSPLSISNIRNLISNSDNFEIVKTETIKMLTPDKGLEKVTILLKGCFLEKELIQKHNIKVIKVNKEFPLMLDADIEVTVRDVCNEGYLENLKIML